MFSNFAWSEMLVIAVVAILVVGPKDLPGMLRSIGKTVGNVKRMAGDFQRQFNDALKDADMDDLKEMTSTKGFAPLEDAKKSMEEFAASMEAPVDTTPEIEAPAVSEPAPAKAAAKPAATKTAAKKPAAKKPTSKSTATKKAAPKKAAAKKPAARKPAAKKSAATKATPAKTASASAAKAGKVEEKAAS